MTNKTIGTNVDILNALKHIQDGASSPYAILAYISIVGAWLYISVIRFRLHTVAKVLKDIPEKDRAKIILKEYNTTPKKGLSAEQWIRARDRMLLFVGFLATLIALLIAFLAVFVDVKRTHSHYDHSALQSLEPPIRDWTEKYSRVSDSKALKQTSKLVVLSILEGKPKDVSSRVFDITLANTDSQEILLTKFLSRWRYHPGTTALVAEGAVLRPLAEYVLNFSIDVLDESWKTRNDSVYPLLILPPKNNSGSGVATFRLQLHYSLEQRYHPSTNWNIDFDVEVADNRGGKLYIFRSASWREKLEK
jgi:hypothetical protein